MTTIATATTTILVYSARITITTTRISQQQTRTAATSKALTTTALTSAKGQKLHLHHSAFTTISLRGLTSLCSTAQIKDKHYEFLHYELTV